MKDKIIIIIKQRNNEKYSSLKFYYTVHKMKKKIQLKAEILEM